METREVLEGDRRASRSLCRAAGLPTPSSLFRPLFQPACDGARRAPEGALKAVLELRAKERLEPAERYRRLQSEMLASADARERALMRARFCDIMLRYLRYQAA